MSSRLLAIALLTRVKLRDHKRYAISKVASWLAWANDTAAHCAAIHCPRQRTVGPTE